MFANHSTPNHFANEGFFISNIYKPNTTFINLYALCMGVKYLCIKRIPFHTRTIWYTTLFSHPLVNLSLPKDTWWNNPITNQPVWIAQPNPLGYNHKIIVIKSSIMPYATSTKKSDQVSFPGNIGMLCLEHIKTPTANEAIGKYYALS